MEHIDYSVIIRTTGKADLKYQKLLDSVSRLVPQPREILVVLPQGNDLPAEQLGRETFLFCPKGMVRQRMAGIEACRTDYALVCDDDISFPPDFVEKLHIPLQKGLGSFSVAPLYTFLPESGANAFLCTMMGSAVPTVFHRHDRYITVLKSTGYSYNRNLEQAPGKYYVTQSAAWTCFYADIRELKRLDFDKEVWLDAHGYSAMDDQTMFYKAWLMGMKTIVVPDAFYEHLDAQTSTKGNNVDVLYSRSFNRIVFWHRFIYSLQPDLFSRIISQLAAGYMLCWIDIRYLSLIIRRRMTKEDYRIYRRGLKDAVKYLQSDEYHNLPYIRH